MGEYIRQEQHDENMEEEYNRDYVVKRKTEVRLMKKVNNLMEASCESNNGCENTLDMDTTKMSTRNIIVTT